MKISKKMREKLYQAIHDEVVNVRIKLKLPVKDDVELAGMGLKIWSEQKRVLGIDDKL